MAMRATEALLITASVLLSNVSFAQIASVSTLVTAQGFLDVCGLPDTSLSKAQLDTAKSAPPSQVMENFKDAMGDRTTEVAMCLAFVAGLELGWKEGHEHGVTAAQFPDGWPKDERKALAALPVKQLEASQAAMTVDVPCIPDYVTLGQKRDIIVKYIRDQQKAGNFLIPIALTSHIAWLAYQQAFYCPAKETKPADTTAK
jgi:hypothetical protein